MRLFSYDEALTELCDAFDELISPKKIARSNSNVIYLLLKAFAKGWEVINSTVYSLYGKFVPTLCSDDDLLSLAYITGTRKMTGSVSGMRIVAVNNSPMPVSLLAGTYTYKPDDETTFTYELESDVEIKGESSAKFTFLSEKVGSFYFTGVSGIQVDSDVKVNESLVFSSVDNADLLGHTEETNLEFRRRILEDTDRQDIITELRDAVRNLPYVFDCNVKFNNTPVPVVYDGFTIPSYHLLLMVNGDIRPGIAETVVNKGVYPTVQAETSVPVTFKNDVFFNGYTVYATPFRTSEFGIKVTYSADKLYISDNQAETSIRAVLFSHYGGSSHFDVLTENDVFNVLIDAQITGLRILGVSLSDPSHEDAEYLTFAKTRIPVLDTVSVVGVDIAEE